MTNYKAKAITLGVALFTLCGSGYTSNSRPSPACALKVCALHGSLPRRAEGNQVDVVLILMTFRPHKCGDTFFFYFKIHT